MEIIGKNKATKRQIKLMFLPILDKKFLPTTLTPYFGAFLACDAQQLENERIADFAHALIAKGGYLVCNLIIS